jgi:hypothetical protein
MDVIEEGISIYFILIAWKLIGIRIFLVVRVSEHFDGNGECMEYRWGWI